MQSGEAVLRVDRAAGEAVAASHSSPNRRSGSVRLAVLNRCRGRNTTLRFAGSDLLCHGCVTGRK